MNIIFIPFVFMSAYVMLLTGNVSGSTTTVSTTGTCILVPVSPEAGETIAGLASSGKQLVKIRVIIQKVNETYEITDHRLSDWVISTSQTGQSMLMLKEYFDAMSLYTLGLSVGSYSLSLRQEPSDCLKGKQTEDIEDILRNRFLSNFGASDHTLPSGAEICHKVIGTEEANRDQLVYVCCKNSQENNPECSELTQSIWIQLLFLAIIILQVLIILYSPIYMPGFMYKAKSIFQKFAYTTEPDKMLELRVKVVTDSSNVDSGFTKTELQEFTHLNKFKVQLENVTPGEISTFIVKGVDVCVRDSKIVSEGDAPISVFSFVKDFFVRCKMRYAIASVGDCCVQDMWVKLPCKVVFRWYECLSGMMMLISAVLLATPLLIRILFYYAIEKEYIQKQTQIYEKHNISMPYPGNMLLYFSQTYYLFYFIHILFAVEILIYIILPGTVKEKVKFTVRKCFRDTRDKSKLDACGMLTSHFLRPLRSYGVIGCLVLPLWLLVLPFYCIAIAIEVIPIANLSVRLLVNLIFYISKVINPYTFKVSDQQEPGRVSTWMHNRFSTIIVKNENEANTRLNKLLHTLALIMTFVTVWLFLILVVECIAFYVECAVYALVGFILNPKNIAKYVSLILLVVVYGYDCFSGVHGRYAAYSTGINGEVQGMVGDKMTHEASKSKKEQYNTAFRVPAKKDAPERMCLMTESGGFLKWKVSRLVLFLDETDIPFIPTSFLFQMGQLNHFQCPGLVHLLYLKAFVDFLFIILFLIFVFIVIFAFGQAGDISTAGQTIAALATGFFPLILKKFLFQSQSYTLDRSNLNWKNVFANAVQRYSENWNFEDIIVAQADETEIKPTSDVTSDEMNTTEMTNFTDVSGTDNSENINLESGKKTEIIDLIVQKGNKSECKEYMIFYVPCHEMKHMSVDAEIV